LVDIKAEMRIILALFVFGLLQDELVKVVHYGLLREAGRVLFYYLVDFLSFV
jgi:hypothetical protein